MGDLRENPFLIFLFIFFISIALTCVTILPSSSTYVINATKIADLTSIYIQLNVTILAISFAILAIFPAIQERWLKEYLIKNLNLSPYIISLPLIALFLSFITFVLSNLGNDLFVKINWFFYISTFLTFMTIFTPLFIFLIIIQASLKEKVPNLIDSTPPNEITVPNVILKSDLNDECDEITLERDEFIFDLISKRNTVEFDRSNTLDSKASGVIGFAGIVIGLIGTIISLLYDKFPTNVQLEAYYLSLRLVLIFSIISLAGSIFMCIFAYSIKTYIIVPNTSHLIEKYAKSKITKCGIIQVVGREISESIKDNSSTNDDKAKFIKYGQFLFAIGIGLIVLFVCGLLII
jgi:hypothetical protein